MATMPAVPDPAPEEKDPYEELKKKYKTPKDLLLDPNFHGISDLEVKRILLGKIYPTFDEYDTKSQDKFLQKKLKDWQDHYAEKPVQEPGLLEKAKSAFRGMSVALPPPPEPYPFKPEGHPPIPASPQAQPPAAEAPKPKETIDQIADRYSNQYGMDPMVLRALIYTESGGDPNAVGDSGKSRGLLQLYDGGRGKGVGPEAFDPEKNIAISMPEIVKAYRQAESEGLTGAQLAARVGQLAQRPRADLVNRYAEAYDALTAGQPMPKAIASELPPPAAAGEVKGKRTELPPDKEKKFRSWYSAWAATAGLDPDPDNPLHKYDYRGAYAAGAKPEKAEDGLYHWPSEFKDDDHPNRFVAGIDTKTGQPVAQERPASLPLPPGMKPLAAHEPTIATPSERVQYPGLIPELTNRLAGYSAKLDEINKDIKDRWPNGVDRSDRNDVDAFNERVTALHEVLQELEPDRKKLENLLEAQAAAGAGGARTKNKRMESLMAAMKYPGAPTLDVPKPEERMKDTPEGYGEIPMAEKVLSAIAQGAIEGFTFGAIKPVGVGETPAEAVASEAGSLVGSIPSYMVLGAAVRPIFGAARNIPTVGKWISKLDQIEKAREVITAGAEATSPGSAAIAAKTITGLADKYPEFSKALTFAIKHPRITDNIVSPLLQGTEAGTVMAAASAIGAIANGEDVSDAVLTSYSTAFLGEMAKTAPAIKDLAKKFKLTLTQPNLSKVVEQAALGVRLPEASAEYQAFKQFMNEYAARPQEEAVGRALQASVAYGLASAGITATLTPGDVTQRLAAGGEAGLRTFIAIGAFHLPSVLSAISARVGRPVDAADATIEYNNMTPKEKKELAASIPPEEVQKATEVVNQNSGSQAGPIKTTTDLATGPFPGPEELPPAETTEAPPWKAPPGELPPAPDQYKPIPTDIRAETTPGLAPEPTQPEVDQKNVQSALAIRVNELAAATKQDLGHIARRMFNKEVDDLNYEELQQIEDGLSRLAGREPTPTFGIPAPPTPGIPAEVSPGPQPEQATVPETPHTIAAQIQTIGTGGRKVVFVPEETLAAWRGKWFEPGTAEDILDPVLSSNPNLSSIDIEGKGRYFYDRELITPEEIQQAVQENRDHELMGIVEPKSPEATIGVTAQKINPDTGAPEEVATAVVSPENLPAQAEQLKDGKPDVEVIAGPADAIAGSVIDQRLEGSGIPGPPQPAPALEIPPVDFISKLEDVDLGPAKNGVVRAQVARAIQSGVANDIIRKLLDGNKSIGEIASEIAPTLPDMTPEQVKGMIRAIREAKGIPKDAAALIALKDKLGAGENLLAPPSVKAPAIASPPREVAEPAGPRPIIESAPSGVEPTRLDNPALKSARDLIRKKLGDRAKDVYHDYEVGARPSTQSREALWSDPDIYSGLIAIGTEYYNNGVSDRAQWHASMFEECEEIAEGLGEDLEPMFKDIWASITDEEDYRGGTGGVYGSFDGDAANISGTGASQGTGEPARSEGGGEAGGTEPSERPIARPPSGVPPEPGTSGAPEKPDIETEARRGARFSPRGRSSVILTKTQRREINAKVADLVRTKVPGDLLTDEEIELLRRYTGSGGLGDTEQERGLLYEHYTSYRIASWMWDKLRAMGFPMDKLTVMDPAFGIGNIPGFAPADARLYGTEIDPTAVKVARLLYPDAKIEELPFEQYRPRRDIDVFASNVPFHIARGGLRYTEEAKRYEDIKALHDFFFVKALDMTKPNGVVMFITSTGTMDGTSKNKVGMRQRINKQAEFLGAYRTPAGEFQANTQYGGSTDIIFLRKRTPEEIENWKDEDYQEDFINALTGSENPIGGKLSQWYVKHPEKAWGEMKPGHGVGLGQEERVGVVMNKETYAGMLELALTDDVKYEAKPTASKATADEEDRLREILGERPREMDAGTITWVDDRGKWGYAQAGTGLIVEATELPLPPAKPVAGNKTAYHRVREGLTLVELTDKLFTALRENDIPEADSLRAKIKPLLAAFQEKWKTAKQNPTGSPATDATLWRYLAGGPATSPYPYSDPRVWKLAALTDPDGKPSSIFTQNNIYLPPPEKRAFDSTDLVDTAKFVYEDRGELDMAEVGRLYTGPATDLVGELVGHPEFSIESFTGTLEPIIQINDEYMFGDLHPKIDQTIQMKDQAEAEMPEGPQKAKVIGALQGQLGELWMALPAQADAAEIINRSDPFSAYVEDRIIVNWLESIVPDVSAEKTFDEERGRYLWHLSKPYSKEEVGVMVTVDVEQQYRDDLGITRTRMVPEPKGVSLEDYLNHSRPTKEVPTGRTDSKGRPTTKTIYDADGEKAYDVLSGQFRTWALAHQEQFETVVPRYNRAYRSFRERFYSDRQLEIPGLSSMFKGKPLKIEPHQWQGVGRAAHQGSGLISYGVGGGKTLTGILLLSYQKARGKIRKPMVIVPAKVIKNWAYEIAQALPDAKIIDLSGMDAQNRYKMLQRTAVSDADFVLATFEGMKEIPLRKAEEYIQEDLQKLEDRLRAVQAARGDREQKKKEKDLQDKLLRMEEKLTKLQQMKKTKTIFFEDLGVDAVLVDEGHNYKNAPRNYGDMQEYVRESKSSERAADMQYKTRYIHERKGGRKGQNVWMTTATPTPNHPSEIYVMMQYVAPEEWTSRGIENAGDFIEQFGRIETREVKEALGTSKAKTIWAGYKNLTELRAVFRRWIDFRPIETLGIKRPKGDYIDVKMAPTSATAEAAGYIAWLEDYLKHDPVNAMVDGINHLSILTRARKLAADASIYDPEEFLEHAKEAGSKLHEVVKNVVANDEGDNTQLIFLDLYRGGIYEADEAEEKEEGKVGTDDQSDLDKQQESEHFVELVNLHKLAKQMLIEQGIPEEAIAIVNGQENSGPKSKFKIQQLNAEGKIRFLIGSRASMGEGMNLQTSTTAIHHVDAPYNASALEQADGRGLRQGNRYDSVKIFRYLMSGTSDAKMYDLIARKDQWGRELWLGDADEILDFDQDGRNFQELSDAAGISQDTVDYYRAKHALDSVGKAIAEVEAIAQKKRDQAQRINDQVEWRTRAIAELEAEVAGGQISDYHRRRLQSHQDNLAQINMEGALVSEEIKKLNERIDQLRGEQQRAIDYVTLYDDAKRLGRTVEELENDRGLPHRDPTHGRSFLAGLDVKIKKPKAKKKPDDALPAPPEDGADTPEAEGGGPEVFNDYEIPEIKTISGPAGAARIETAASRANIYAANREARKGPAWIATYKSDDVLPSLRSGDIPIEIIYAIASAEGDKIDPNKVKAEPAGQGWTINNQGFHGGQYRLVKRGDKELDLLRDEGWGRIEIPELMNLVRDLTGKPVMLNKRLAKSLGRFVGGLSGLIQIRPDMFKAEYREQLARTLAHEIGHLVDWLPDHYMKRGNLIGRLLTMRRMRKQHWGKIIASDKKLRSELIALSEHWKPYDNKKVPDSYVKYRRSSAELYADFVSVLLNSPGTAQKFAPNFYREFHAYLDRKPEFKEAYLKLRLMMQGTAEEFLNDRLNRTGVMLTNAEAASQRIERQEHNQRRQFWKGVLDNFFDMRWEIEQRVNKLTKAGVEIPESSNPKYLWDELAYKLRVDQWAFMDKVQKEVFEEIILPANISPDDIGYSLFGKLIVEDEDGKPNTITNDEPYSPVMALGLYMFLHRSATQRANVANPMVAGGEYASETLDMLRERMGHQKFAALEEAARKYHDLTWPLVEEGFQKEVYPARAYASFVENKYNYVKYVGVDHIRKYVSPMVRAQIGFAGDLENPLISDLKMRLSLINLNALQGAKQSVINLLKNYYPEEISRAKAVVESDAIKTWREEPGKGVIEILEDGRVVGYLVDKYIAEAVNQVSPTALSDWLKWTDHFHNTWWQIVISYNLGFGGWGNPNRDFWTNFKKLPLKNVVMLGDLIQLLKAYGQAFPHVRRWLAGEGDDMIKQMILNYEWNLPMSDVVSDEEDTFHLLLKRTGVIKDTGQIDKGKAQMFHSAARYILGKIRYPSDFFELAGKTAGHIVRVGAGEKGKKLGFNMRRMTSTPAWYRQGKLSKFPNRAYPFSTIFIQGWASEYVAATDPETRSGYWLRMTKLLTLKMLAWALGAGLLADFLGDELSEWYKRMYGGLTKYMESNYLNVVIGETHDGKPIYIPFPVDEGTRMIFGIFNALSRGMEMHDPDTLTNVGRFIWSQLPNITPMLNVPWSYLQYYGLDINPTDDFRMTPVLSDSVAKDKGWEAFNRIGLHSLNQLGLGQFQTYDDGTKSWYEVVPQYLPSGGMLVGRIVRIGGYGETERQKDTLRIADIRRNEGIVEKRGAGESVAAFYRMASTVNRHSDLVRLGLSNKEDRKELERQYPSARFKRQFDRIARSFSEDERKIQAVRQSNLPADVKQQRIEAIKQKMDEKAKNLLRYVGIELNKLDKQQGLPQNLPGPQGLPAPPAER